MVNAFSSGTIVIPSSSILSFFSEGETLPLSGLFSRLAELSGISCEVCGSDDSNCDTSVPLSVSLLPTWTSSLHSTVTVLYLSMPLDACSGNSTRELTSTMGEGELCEG